PKAGADKHWQKPTIPPAQSLHRSGVPEFSARHAPEAPKPHCPAPFATDKVWGPERPPRATDLVRGFPRHRPESALRLAVPARQRAAKAYSCRNTMGPE